MSQSRSSSSRISRSESDRRKSLNPNRVPWNPSNQNNGRKSVSQSYSPRLSKGEKYREQKSIASAQKSDASARDRRSGKLSFSDSLEIQSLKSSQSESLNLKT